MTPYQINKNHVINLEHVEAVFDTGEKRVVRMVSGHEYKTDEPMDQLEADIGEVPSITADKKPASWFSWIWGG